MPDLSQLSRLADPSEADHLVTVNPRYDHGLLGRTDAARDAYDAAVKAHTVACKCGSADLAAMSDARIAAEFILLRAIIARDNAGAEQVAA